MTSSSGSSFCLDTSASAVQPFPSTASIVRFFLNDDGAKQSSLPTGVGAVRYMDNTFNDSGFRVTLIEPPESWGSRANDRSRKPGLLRLSPDTREDPHPNDQYWHHSLLHEHLFETPSLEILDYQWTFDERLAISLLEAGLTKARRESGRPMKRPQSKYRLVAAASAKIIRATKQCFSKTLWH
ncbi:hypothetical protein BDZ97DRAFT_1814285 [Flammula alnicola]|nr:hypothetical protein BDZ97DRAFT_1814285 [Flammula alnicola]